MKIKLILTIMIVIFLTTLTATVTPASAAKERSIKLVDVTIKGGKGVAFYFKVTGKFKEKELNGFVLAGDNKSIKLDCHSNESGFLVCAAHGGLRQLTGASVQIFLAGYSFTAVIPEQPSSYCYPIYDYDTGGESDPNNWHDYGPHCQDTGAQEGDEVEYYNPDWGDTDLAGFYHNGEDSPHAPANFGPGYYYKYTL
jgi:hypothetical protein